MVRGEEEGFWLEEALRFKKRKKKKQFSVSSFFCHKAHHHNSPRGEIATKGRGTETSFSNQESDGSIFPRSSVSFFLETGKRENLMIRVDSETIEKMCPVLRHGSLVTIAIEWIGESS